MRLREDAGYELMQGVLGDGIKRSGAEEFRKGHLSSPGQGSVLLVQENGEQGFKAHTHSSGYRNISGVAGTSEVPKMREEP